MYTLILITMFSGTLITPGFQTEKGCQDAGLAASYEQPVKIQCVKDSKE